MPETQLEIKPESQSAAAPEIKRPARIGWIDMVRAVAIWIMVWVHFGLSQNVQALLSVSALQAMMFLSGYLEKDNKTLKEVALNSFKTIIVPYMLFYAVFYIYWFVMDFLFHMDIYSFQPTENGPMVLTLLKPIIGMVLCWGYYQTEYSMMLPFALWWLPALFFTRIMHKLIIMASKGSKVRYAICVAASIALIVIFRFFQMRSIRIPFCIDCALLLLPFFEMGYLAKKKGIIKSAGRNTPTQSIAYLLVGIIGFTVIAIAIRFNGMVDLLGFDYGQNLLMYLALCVVGVISFISLCLLYTGSNPLIALFSSGAIVILAFHSILIPYINILYAVFGLQYYNNIILALMALLDMFIMIVPINIIQKYFPILVGGRKLK